MDLRNNMEDQKMNKNETMNKWDWRFLKMAFEVAGWSKDPSSKVGAVIAKKKKFISIGFNGPPANVNDDPSMPRPTKYKRTIHAEPNAILAAHRKLKNCSIYVTHHPCSQCAATIIQSKIKRVVCPKPSDDFLSRWAEDMEEAQKMFEEAGVILEVVDYVHS